jgi:hypothetical protein
VQALDRSRYCIPSTRFIRFETFVIATLVQLRYKFVRKEGIVWNGSTCRCAKLQTRRFIPGGVPSGTATSTKIFVDIWWKKENSHSSLIDNVGAHNSRYQFRIEFTYTTQIMIRYNSSLLSCTKAHWENCGILPEYLPTSSRLSYT